MNRKHHACPALTAEPVPRRTDDHGQATVELALALPLVCLMLCAIVQVAVLARDRVAVQLAAREAARAAVVAADPHTEGSAAARRATRLPIDVVIVADDAVVTATVAFTDHTDVPLIGPLLPDVRVEASVTMALEPP